MMDDGRDFVRGLLGAALVVAIVTAIFTTIANNGLTPEMGNPFYGVWVGVTRYGWQALILIIPGIGAAAYVVLKLFPDSGGF